jgi:hypothetical protein
MRMKFLAIACIGLLILTTGACKKKEEPPPVVPRTGIPGQQQAVPPGTMPMIPKGEKNVVLPDSVKGNWKGVVIEVENKTTNKTEEFTIDLNSEFVLPGSNLKISVGEFLPDFRMEGLTITSKSNEENNPSVNVKIIEDDKEIFKGWLYSKFPSIHPFEHPDYTVKLKNGVKKG